VNGRGALAALVAHHLCGLAGEGCEQHLAIDTGGEVLGQRGLAGARVAEQPEDGRRVAATGLGLEPFRHRLERCVLFRRKVWYGSFARGAKLSGTKQEQLSTAIARGSHAAGCLRRHHAALACASTAKYLASQFSTTRCTRVLPSANMK